MSEVKGEGSWDAENAENAEKRRGFSDWTVDGIIAPGALCSLAFFITWNLKSVIARRPRPTWRSHSVDCSSCEIATVAALLRNDGFWNR
jgi:hypothetical protein